MRRVSSYLIVVAFVAVLSSVTTAAAERGFTSSTQNVALASNGAVAAASSTGFGDTEFSSAGKLIDNTRSGADSYWTDV